MSATCERCGIGRRAPGRTCDWCAAPARPRFPVWIAARRRLRRSRPAAVLRQRGPVVTGMVVGVVLHLLTAAVGVAFGLASLWQTGFLWSQQWWWVLMPEPAQPWAFAALRGAAYGALAGVVAALQASRARRQAPGALAETSPLSRAAIARVPEQVFDAASTRFIVLPSPASVTSLAAFLVSSLEPSVGTQHRLIAAALGAAVGRLTALVLRSGSRTAGSPPDPSSLP